MSPKFAKPIYTPDNKLVGWYRSHSGIFVLNPIKETSLYFRNAHKFLPRDDMQHGAIVVGVHPERYRNARMVSARAKDTGRGWHISMSCVKQGGWGVGNPAIGPRWWVSLDCAAIDEDGVLIRGPVCEHEDRLLVSEQDDAAA